MKRTFTVKTELKKKPGIYKISCTETDKVYIGESVDISRRMQKHFSLLRKNKHSNPILQNIFNKYGESTFVVEVLEYTSFNGELELKKLEQFYQKKEKNCISLDSNEIFCVTRTQEWVDHQTELLNKYREKMLDELVRKPVIIYDIITKESIRFKQISEAEELVERKHISKNIDKKILIPYKHRYVAFLEEEFTEENIGKIITVKGDIAYGAVRNLCNLYNLETGEVKYFASKAQFSLEFSNSKNYKLYDMYLNEHFIDFNFRCVEMPKNKQELYSFDIFIKEGLRSKKCNFKVWYDGLHECPTNVALAEKCGIDRKILGQAFKKRSRVDWIKIMDKIISTLPD